MNSKSRPKALRKESKVQLRLRPGQKDLIARAAQIKQTTLTHFMVEHAFNAAQEVLADQVHFSLSPDRWDSFCAALDAPPKVIPALRKLLKKPSVFDNDAADS
jgi:uncharacterized protein (DUF1778 family)